MNAKKRDKHTVLERLFHCHFPWTDHPTYCAGIRCVHAAYKRVAASYLDDITYPVVSSTFLPHIAHTPRLYAQPALL